MSTINTNNKIFNACVVLIIIAIFTPSLKAEIIFYEPYDYADGSLLQDVSDWSRISGALTAMTPGLSYGTLPVTGVHGRVQGRYTLNSVASDLAAAGLLADGQTLWMSALISPLTGSNANLVVNLGTDFVNEWSSITGGTGDSLGFTVQGGDDLQARYFLDGALVRPSNVASSIPIGTTVIVVIEMVWNADPAQPDTINYYLPDSNLNIGSIRRTIDTAAFDQASFDTFGVAGVSNAALLDEIRFGRRYENVIGSDDVDETAPYPVIASNNDFLMWSGASIQLDPVAVNNDTTPLTYQWTASPSTGAVFTDSQIRNPGLTITNTSTLNPTTYTITLAVNNEGSTREDVLSAFTIDVYDNACLAAKAAGTANIDSTDLNSDCVTDLEDLAMLAMQWFVDYSLTGPVDK